MKTLLQASILFSFILFASCGDKKVNEGTETTAKYVKVERVADTQAKDKMVFNGKVKEKSLTSLSFRVGGPLVKLNVKTGDYVKKGEVIAAIDKRDYQLQLQAKKAQYEQLKGEYTRYKELKEKNKIPANSFEKIESGYLMAKTGYESAQNQLQDTELRAPISGYIYQKFTENFQTVGAGHPIVSIINKDQLEIVVSVPENQILEVKNCKNSFVDVKNAGAHELPVELLSVSEKTMQDGMYEVKFLLRNTNGHEVSPGMSAELTMQCKNANLATSIPSSAVFRKENATYVWVYDETNKSVNQRKVETQNIRSGGRIEVLSGLRYDELIVTAGVHSLYENQTVQPIKKPAASNIGGLL